MLLLNCDMGEGYGAWSMGSDTEIMPHIDIANIACGFHASDPFIMSETVALAKQYGVSISAHPAYPDLHGFGRRAMDFSPQQIHELVLYQVGALQGICHTHGVKVEYVKPHGALYHAMMENKDVYKAILGAITVLNRYSKTDSKNPVGLIVQAGIQRATIEAEAKNQSVPLLFEAFSDRAYDDEGYLVSRKQKGALLDLSEVKERVYRLDRHQQVISLSGKTLAMPADTLCLHGDHKEAIAMAKMIRSCLNTQVDSPV